ncbi:MAG: sulfatase-like hydrolase/transferase [Rhodopirellula sp. JB044]|uniref:sulfatase-like hydrolase/transferase n=1 Tax=Rhodopirellula sp. JB044 TaxID=3342844 RepID=UPI00370C57CF
MKRQPKVAGLRYRMCRPVDRVCLVLAFVTSIVFASPIRADATEPTKQEDRTSPVAPNVLVMMADDLGYSDLGCYGGEIDTPAIDQLAGEGVRFSHFRATPMCVTSRIALLSGMPFDDAGRNAYSHAMPLPILLQNAGYRTMMTGKWHAGTPDPREQRLFHRAFGFLGGMTDCFVGGDDWFLDSQPFRDFDADFYSTDAIAEKSIEFMDEAAQSDQPFFMYVAFNAPHHPCQAPRSLVEKYLQRYEKGYEAIRSTRHQRQIQLGIIGEDMPLAEVSEETRRWDELTEHRKQVEAGRMAAYAAAVEGVDTAVGRIMRFLDDHETTRDTLVIFLSDNGGDYNNGGIDHDEKQVAWAPGGNPSSSNGWASVKATPFRYYKHACHEGGIAAPLIIRWPRDRGKSGRIVHESASITDFYPTLVELAGAEYPRKFEGRRLRPLSGSSLMPLLAPAGKRKSLPGYQRYDVSKAWIENDWKAVSLYNGPWQLFDLKNDRSERNDLAAEHPERLGRLVKQWNEHAKEVGVPKTSLGSSTQQKGWGWHRLKMVCPHLIHLSPANGSTTSSQQITVSMQFDEPIDFTGTEGKFIRLYSVSNESQPVWEASPDAKHASQGENEIVFHNIPELQPDQGYYFRWDPGWIHVGNHPVGVLNDGAFWWRFRTPVE